MLSETEISETVSSVLDRVYMAAQNMERVGGSDLAAECAAALSGGYASIMALFDAATAREWTACADRLPDDGVHVLTWAPRDDPVNRFALCYRSGGHWYMTGASHSPRYWKPLDEPPLPAPPVGKED